MKQDSSDIVERLNLSSEPQIVQVSDNTNYHNNGGASSAMQHIGKQIEKVDLDEGSVYQVALSH